MLRALLWSLGGIAALVAGLMLGDWLQARDLAVRRPLYFAAAGAYAGAWVLAWVWNVFNDLISLRNRVRIVNALRDHERNVHEQLAALRTQMTATLPGLKGPGHQALKPALIAVQGKYPVLKAMPAFLKLQKELVDTEERVALARDYFNNIATHFNTRIEQVPDRFVGMLTVMRRFPLLSAQDFERAAVKVDFTK